MYIELNAISLLKILELTTGHLKVGKFLKTLSLGDHQMMKQQILTIFGFLR
jgi:hypothetical protein